MGAHVAVAGASGYAGGELLRLLASHPGLVLGPVTAGSHAGEPVRALHPHLPQLSDRMFEPTDPERLAQADLVFLALPHGRSAAVAAALPGTVKVVDLGADFRLADPGAWQEFYGNRPGEPGEPARHAGRWTYGLPELAGARKQIRAATRVAVPGCYATAAILALAPLLTSGLVEPSDLVIVAASGTSGAGRGPQRYLLGAEVMGAVSAYQVGGVHRHIPEIEQALGEALSARHASPAVPAAPAVPAVSAGSGMPGGAPVAGLPSGSGLPGVTGEPAVLPATTRMTVCFTPLLAPMPRGILATCTARLAAAALSGTHRGPGGATARLRAALSDAYGGEPFVQVLPQGSWPSTAATAGSNAAHLQAAADTRTGRAVVVAAIDNLGKGAAGQAVQNANLMIGLPETAGLTADGVAP